MLFEILKITSVSWYTSFEVNQPKK